MIIRTENFSLKHNFESKTFSAMKVCLKFRDTDLDIKHQNNNARNEPSETLSFT